MDRPTGRLVLGLHPPERVAVLDIASGRLRERRLPGGTLCHGPLMVSGERIVFAGGRAGRAARMALDLDLRRRARVLAWGAVAYLPAVRTGALWTYRMEYAGRSVQMSRLREVTADGEVLFLPRRRPPAGLPTAAVPAGIVFENGARTRIWNPRSGALRRAPGLWTVAASSRGSAWCSGRCGTLRLLGPGPDRDVPAPRGWSFATNGSFSPDSSLLAVPVYRGEGWRIALVRTATASVRLLDSPAVGSRGETAWSPSGEWLYLATKGRRIVAYRPADGRSVRLGVRLADEVIDLSAAPTANG